MTRDVKCEPATDPTVEFARHVIRLIWDNRRYSLAIVLVTVVQELIALWPVALLGQFVDRLGSGDPWRIAWILMGATLLSQAIVRGNTMLRHKMFYETDFRKRLELTMKVRSRGGQEDAEDAGSANTLIAQAVSGITNAAYHVLGSFTPVIVKIVVVSGALLAYNRMIGLVYMASLIVPTLLTLVFNKMLRGLQRRTYSTISRAEGIVIRALSTMGRPPLAAGPNDEGAHDAREEQECEVTLKERRNVLFEILWKGQWYALVREEILVGCQFLVVFIALGKRQEIGLTPGDFTRILGYTAQVAAAFMGTAGCVDAIVSYSRAYHVYADSHER